jgi:hypothetical protein
MSQPSAPVRDMAVPQPHLGPVPVPRVAPQRRWRPVLVFPAIAMIAAGGLLAAFALRSVATTQEYLGVVRQVQVGAMITRADLTTVRINRDPALKPIHASQARAVVNKYAAVTLLPGTLLTMEHVTGQSILGPGRQLVGLTLPQERMPSRDRVRPGMKVMLVLDPDTVLTGPQKDVQSTTIEAIVVDIGPAARETSRSLNVSVPERDGPLVASKAAAGRISITITAG